MIAGEELTGKVTGVFYGRGYGFVEDEGLTAYFFHAHEVQDFDRIAIDDEVVFFRAENERGPRAVRVRKKA